MTANRDDRIADLVTTRALDPGLSRPDWVSDSEWEEITQLALIERELRDGAEAPPLERDRVAAMLGLVADPALQLNPAGLKRHRQRAGLTPSQVAAMLAARGWDITQRDIFRWENQSSADVPPAVIEALAQVVRATTEDLTSRRDTNASLLDAGNPVVQGLASRLAAALGIGGDMALARLRTAAAGSFHRGVKPENDQLLATLDGYVRAMERRRGS